MKNSQSEMTIDFDRTYEEVSDAIKNIRSSPSPSYLLVMKYDHDYDGHPIPNPDTTGWTCHPTSEGIPGLAPVEFTCFKKVEQGWFGRFK